MSRFRKLAAGLSCLALMVVSPAAAHAGGLTFVESLLDLNRLGNAEAIAVSATHVYVAASQAESVTSWEREPDGTLVIDDEEYDDINGVDEIARPAGIAAITPVAGTDHVYVTSLNEHAVTFFESVAGALVELQVMEDGVGLVTDMGRPTDVTISPDGKNVYVTSQNGNAIIVFTRNLTTGMLTFVEAEKQDPPNVTGMEKPRGGVVTPDNKFFYTTGRVDPGDNSAATVVVFQRNYLGDGSLSFVQSLANLDGSPTIQRLQGTESVLVSSDDKHLYVACRGSDSVLIFERNLADGKLTFLEFVHAGGAFKGIKGAYAMATDADGHFYVTGFNDNALVMFSRNATNGRLTPLQAFFNPKELPPSPALLQGLGQPAGVKAAPGGGFVYVAGRGKGTIVTFENDICGDNNTGIDEQCDDGPSGSATCTTGCKSALCGTMPDPGPCRTPTVINSAELKITNDATKEDAKDAVDWKWKKGPMTPIGDYGDPVNTDDYVLCVYDATGALVMGPLAAPTGGTCKNAKACWKAPNSAQFKYSDSLLTPSGLSSVQVKADHDENGKTQVSFKGKGAFLLPPTLPIPGPALPLKVQARSTVANGCWEATHDTFIKNDPGKFQFKGD